MAERLVTEASQNDLLLQNQGAATSSVINTLGYVYERALKGFSVTLTPESAAFLKNKSEVEDVVPDQATELHAIQIPTPSWGLDRIDQRDLPLDQSYEYLADGSAVHA